MIARRTLVLAGAGMIIAGKAARADPVPADAEFRVFRKGADIGRHAVRFQVDGDRVVVTTAIDIKVKVAFITLASFRQDAVETWRRWQLVDGRSRTVDGSEVYDIEIVPQVNALAVQGKKRRTVVPAGTMTDISFWNRNIVDQSRLLDTQTTDLIPMTSSAGIKETVDMGNGRTAVGYRFTLDSPTGRSGNVWYDEQGKFLRTAFTTRGEFLEYYPV